jgi:hypothetical protein
VYVLQRLDALVGAAVKRVSQSEVGALEIVDGGDASSLTSMLSAFPQGVSRVLEETCAAIGVDARALMGTGDATKGGAK